MRLYLIGSGVIDLGLDFSQRRDRERERDGKRGGSHGDHEAKKSQYASSSSHGTHHHQQRDRDRDYRQEDNKKSQLCSFLFTMSGCSQGDLCRFKHGDVSRASRGDKERVLKTLERMKRTDIDYDLLK